MADLLSVNVAVENTLYHFDKLFEYAVPDQMRSRAVPGVRVVVPFGKGNSTRLGVILRVNGVINVDGVKRIKEIKDAEPLIDEGLLRLVFWLRERTFCTYYEAFHCMLPSGLNMKLTTFYAANPEPGNVLMTESEDAIYKYLFDKCAYVARESILKSFSYKSDSGVLEDMYAKGYLIKNVDADRLLGDLTAKTVRLNIEEDEYETVLNGLTAKQRSVVKVLREAGSASVKEICYFTGVTSAVITALEKKGIAEIFNAEVYRRPDSARAAVRTDFPELSPEQERVFSSLRGLMFAESKKVSLLYGITGSGKTMVYLKLIEAAVSHGKTAMLLVPEISLTPQIIARFSSYFGDKVAILHSALSVGERLDEWKRIKRGEATIVIGTRSAVFSPLSDLGIIIIDEEQEHTYKSEQTPRFNAKEVARFRCEQSNALLLLGSATPSVESFARAKQGIYHLECLKSRYGRAELPEVITADINEDRIDGNRYTITTKLAAMIKANLEQGKQAILLINRRGYNTFAVCRSCKRSMTCPNCSISLTYHSTNGRLMCHYCGYSVKLPEKCPDCGSHDIHCGGFGTQLIEDELAQLFPEASVIRMDRDSTMRKNSHERVLKDFAEGKYDILVGTQMVAKGIDFENVTLVGVISVDQQLYNDDYRSLERTFSLLTQVVGRAGRGGYEGKAVIQTLTPENEIIALAAAQDYESFFSTEIVLRKLMTYPPYCDLCLIGFSGTEEVQVKAGAKVFLKKFKELSTERYPELKLIVLGPLQPRVAKVCGRHRVRMIVKCKNTKRFREMISELLVWFGSEKRFGELSVFVDINPENLF